MIIASKNKPTLKFNFTCYTVFRESLNTYFSYYPFLYCFASMFSSMFLFPSNWLRTGLKVKLNFLPVGLFSKTFWFRFSISVVLEINFPSVQCSGSLLWYALADQKTQTRPDRKWADLTRPYHQNSQISLVLVMEGDFIWCPLVK